MPTLKEVCFEHHGEWNDRFGCTVYDSNKRVIRIDKRGRVTEGRGGYVRFYDLGSKKEYPDCVGNGDEVAKFHGIEACRERQLEEYCKEHIGYDTVEGCLQKHTLPTEKTLRSLDGPWHDMIVATQDYALKGFPEILTETIKRTIMYGDNEKFDMLDLIIKKRTLSNKQAFMIIDYADLLADKQGYVFRGAALLQTMVTANKEAMKEYAILDRLIESKHIAHIADDMLRVTYGWTGSGLVSSGLLAKLLLAPGVMPENFQYVSLESLSKDAVLHYIDKLLHADNKYVAGVSLGSFVTNLQAKITEEKLPAQIVERLLREKDVMRGPAASAVLGHLNITEDQKNRLLDGFYGPTTKDAMREFFRNHQLTEQQIRHVFSKPNDDEYAAFIFNTRPDIFLREEDLRKAALMKVLRTKTTRHVSNRIFKREDFDQLIAHVRKELIGVDMQTRIPGLGEPPSMREEQKYEKYYMKYAVDPSHPLLHEYYEHVQLSPEQIDKALELGLSVNQLFSYQKNLEQRHIDYAINKNIALDMLFTSPRVSDEQKKMILKKMMKEEDWERLQRAGISVNVLDSPLWSNVSPRILVSALRQYSDAVNIKRVETPFQNVTGVYDVKETPFEKIKGIIVQKKMFMKPGDMTYAYYVDKAGREQKVRVGRVLQKTGNEELLREYGVVQQSIVDTKLRERFGEATGDIEVVISVNPEDIARKSTGQNWTSCETVGGDYGWGAQCGWCDDIAANNAIAFIRKRGAQKWLGRVMVRWCQRHRESTRVYGTHGSMIVEPADTDAAIEQYHGDPRYKDVLIKRTQNILRNHGFSARDGDASCLTPYQYSGYLEKGRSHNQGIEYRVGEKPGEVNQ